MAYVYSLNVAADFAQMIGQDGGQYRYNIYGWKWLFIELSETTPKHFSHFGIIKHVTILNFSAKLSLKSCVASF